MGLPWSTNFNLSRSVVLDQTSKSSSLAGSKIEPAGEATTCPRLRFFKIVASAGAGVLHQPALARLLFLPQKKRIFSMVSHFPFDWCPALSLAMNNGPQSVLALKLPALVTRVASRVQRLAGAVPPLVFQRETAPPKHNYKGELFAWTRRKVGDGTFCGEDESRLTWCTCNGML